LPLSPWQNADRFDPQGCPDQVIVFREIVFSERHHAHKVKKAQAALFLSSKRSMLDQSAGVD
jgi:hypothetical protein